MQSLIGVGLNDSGIKSLSGAEAPRLAGEDGTARLIPRAALHLSRGQSTSRHSHPAWKVHVGLDAPVWLESSGASFPSSAGARVVVVPPNVPHATGAVGWSLAVFVAPGSRGTPWKWQGAPWVASGAEAGRAIELCRGGLCEPSDCDAFVADLARAALPQVSTSIDGRVREALDQLRTNPDFGLPALAAHCELSLDRLSRLAIQQTGLPLRRHVLWSRLLRAFTYATQPVASMAFSAGFSDHAHLTRTYRAHLGRVPSQFDRPPEVIAPW